MNLARLYEARICPACGYHLNFTPWEGDDFHEHPCPCCGIMFGFDDLNQHRREQTYLLWRERWIESGMQWWSGQPAPDNWDANKQLTFLQRIEE
jgi:hypothetical protein